MADSKFISQGCPKDVVCIDTYRVLDSCRDKDCFENVKVYLTSFGQEIIERTNIVRAKYSKVLSAYIDIDEVPFNCGFYQLSIKLFVKLICEACLGAGNIQEFEGITVLEKKVILFGSQGSVSVFKSEDGCNNAFCPSESCGRCSGGTTLPVAVIETVDPVVLDTKVHEPSNGCCTCCCCLGDIPDGVARYVNGSLCDSDSSNTLTVSLGLFSVIRIERPAQLLVNAAEYSVPEKQCVEAKEDDPCSVFRSMPFPINEFSPPSVRTLQGQNKNGSCGCGC